MSLYDVTKWSAVMIPAFLLNRAFGPVAAFVWAMTCWLILLAANRAR
jgi:hypothetical protein